MGEEQAPSLGRRPVIPAPLAHLKHPARAILLSTAVGLLVVLWLLLKMGPVATPAKWDECLMVYDAQRVLGGAVPYRDFFNFTPPAIFYALAGWFRLWGSPATLTLGRGWALVVALLSTWLCARALRRAAWPRGWAAGLACLFPLGLFAFWPVPSHHWLGVVIWLASLEAYDFGEGKVRGAWGWVWIGATGGAAFMTLQTTAVEMAMYWGVLWALGGQRRVQGSAWASLGLVLTAGASLLWFGGEGALKALWNDTILWTARSYGAKGGPNAVGLLADLPSRFGALWQRPEAVGRISWGLWALSGTLTYAGLVAAALFAIGLALFQLARILRERRIGARLASAAMVLTFLDLALFLSGKTDLLHLVYVLGPVMVAWAMLGPPSYLSVPRGGRASAAALACVFAALTMFHLGFLLYHRPALWEFTDVDRPTREAPVNTWLRAQPWLLPSDTVAAFPEGGQVYLYTRPAAVGYTLFQPLCDHLHTIRDHQIVAAQLEARKPRCIILTAERETDYLDPASPVATVLRRDYVRYALVADAVIYRRKGTP